MKTFYILLLTAFLLSSSLFAQYNPVIIQGDDSYKGPSRFTNSSLRDEFGSAGANVDPALAEELDRRVNACGDPCAHNRRFFSMGEFKDKTLGQAINIVTAEFKKRSPKASVASNSVPNAVPNAVFKEIAIKLYPDLKDPNSTLMKKWWEIYNQLKAANDPVVLAPDSTLKIAIRAANSMSILPSDK